MSQALIIDDNAKNVDVLARLLAAEGIGSAQVTHPNQLETALEALDSVDVVFLDLELPGLNGYQVLDLLKADPRFRATPIVAYSVHLSEINTAYQQGFDGFLGKPIRFDRFPDQIRRILSGDSVWEAQ